MFFRRTETAPVALYGKLPIAKDYLRLGFGRGGALAFREWLDRAFSGQGEPPVLAEPMEFVAGASWDTGLVGVALPSSDQGGLRKFPFVLAIERKPKAIARDVKDGLAQARTVHDALRGLLGTVQAATDARSLLDALRARTIDVGDEDGPAEESEPAIELDAWLAALWPESAREGLDETLATVGRLVASGYPGPLRLPLVPDLPVRPQVRAWVSVLERFGALEPGSEAPSIFYPAGWGKSAGGWASCVVFRGSARPDFAHWLKSEGPGPDTAGDLWGKGPQPAGSGRKARENVPPLVDSLRGIVAAHVARARST